MDGIKKIIFVFNQDQFKLYSELNKDNFYEDSSIILIASTLKLRLFLDFSQIKYRTQDEYITQIQAEKMDKIAFNIGENWHKELFKFQGISLGKLVQLQMKYYLSRIIRNLQTIINIIEIEKPSEIISFEENEFYIKELNDAIEYVCLLRNIPFHLINKNEIMKINKKQIIKYKLKNLIFLLAKSIKKISIRLLLNLLMILKELRMKIRDRNRKTILNFEIGYQENLFYAISKIYNLYSYYIDIYNYRLLFENLKNIFINSKSVFNISHQMYYSFNIQKQVNSFFRDNFSRWKEIIDSSNFQQNFLYNNIELWPLVKAYVYQILNHFKFLIKIILILNKILKKINPHLIIFSSDVWEQPMALSIIASKLKIPSLTIQHGTTGNNPVALLPTFVKKYGVWGKISQDHMINHGIENERLEIVGCPRFDKYINIKKKNELNQIKKSVYKKFNINKNQKLIVYVTSDYDHYVWLTSLNLNPSNILNSFKILLETFKDLSNCFLIIKLRSEEDNDFIILELIKKLKLKNISITKKYPIIELITACDCFISGESTTVLEAMLLKKPVICLNLRNFFYLPYLEYNAVYQASNSAELYDMIQKSLNESFPLENYNKLLKDYLYKIDGLSTKRVLDLIDNMINKT